MSTIEKNVHLFFSKNIPFVPIVSKAIRDIGNIIALYDKLCQALQMYPYTSLL